MQLLTERSQSSFLRARRRTWWAQHDPRRTPKSQAGLDTPSSLPLTCSPLVLGPVALTRSDP